MPEPRRDGAPTLIRDQQRALHAYEMVQRVEPRHHKDYKIAINDLGATILRSGLSAALAMLERQKGGRGGVVLEHLAGAALPGLEGVTSDQLPARVRSLDVDAYMMVTREVLQVAAWLKRAAQATLGDD